MRLPLRDIRRGAYSSLMRKRSLTVGLTFAVAATLAVLLLAPWSQPSTVGRAWANENTAVGFAEGGTLLQKSAQEVNRDFAAARRLGATWVRVEVNWRNIESTPGVYNWADVDKVVNAARRNQLQVLGLVTFAPQWAADPGGLLMPGSRPSNTAAFGGFAGVAAARYAASINAWEVWNEPNLPLFFSPAPDARIYGQALRAAYPAIHRANPSAKVLSAGLAIANDTPTTISPRTFVRSLYAQGLKGYFDAVALHPYTFPHTPTNDPNGNWADLSEVRAVMVANGDSGKKIWITEFGAPTGSAADAVSDQRQKTILAEAISQARSLDYVGGPFFVYTIRDTGADVGNREDNFGVLRRNYSEKPAAQAIRDATGG